MSAHRPVSGPTTPPGGTPGKSRGLAVKERPKTKRPPLYKVIIHNDDYTTMEFVIEVLVAVFNKGRTDATRIMLLVHHLGHGVVGVYPFDVAETLVHTATDYARGHGHPLKVTMEPE